MVKESWIFTYVVALSASLLFCLNMFRKYWILLSVVLSVFLCLDTVKAAEPGLMFHLPFEGDAKDVSGNGFDGAIQGAHEFVDDGIVGQAILLSGGEVQIPGNAAFETPNLTGMFWMRPSSDLEAGDPRMNIYYWAGGPMFAYNKLPAAEEPVGPAGTIRCWIDTLGEVSKGTLFTKNSKWEGGVWYHLAVTYDGKEMVLYEDGVETGRVELDGAVKPRANQPVRIGNAFPGTIDEVKYYDRGLSAREVIQFGDLAVESTGKLTSTWGRIKLSH